MDATAAAGAAPIPISTASPSGDFEYRSHCPGCGSSAHTQVASIPYDSRLFTDYLGRHYEGRAQLDRLASKTYELWRCTDCGLLYQPLVPAGSLLQDIYDAWIGHRDRNNVDDLPTLHESRYRLAEIDFMLQSLDKPPGLARYLDFGSGWADALLSARAFGCDVTGCELSLERQAYTRALGIRMLTLDEVTQQRFDIINLEQVLEHLVDPHEVIGKLASALNPGGILRVTVPDGRGMEARVGRLQPGDTAAPGQLMPVHPLEHINCFDFRSLSRLGERHGLTPLMPSLRKLYDASSGWVSGKGGLRNLMRPIYRHVWPKSPQIYFTRRP